MATFTISGKFYKGITWEDFCSEDSDYPHVTIMKISELMDDESKESGLHEANWYDIIIPNEVELTEEKAKELISKHLGIEAVEIKQLGKVMAI